MLSERGGVRSFGGLGDGLMMTMMMFSLSSLAYLGDGLLVGFGSQPAYGFVLVSLCRPKVS